MPLTEIASPDKRTIRKFFDGIAGRYDILNSILSLRLDVNWRRRAAELVIRPNDTALLDLGVGTGKFLTTFLDRHSWQRAAGLDFSARMLEVAGRETSGRAELVRGDFHDLPFADASFDVAISSFTLRSVKDMPRFFSQVFRLLVPGGRFAQLCLTRPGSPVMRLLYYPYLKFYLPLVGRLISGDRDAYRFLSESIQNFQEPVRTMAVLKEAGFEGVRCFSFSLGLATLFLADKPGGNP